MIAQYVGMHVHTLHNNIYKENRLCIKFTLSICTIIIKSNIGSVLKEFILP